MKEIIIRILIGLFTFFSLFIITLAIGSLLYYIPFTGYIVFIVIALSFFYYIGNSIKELFL